MRSGLLQQCLSVALPSSCVLCGTPDNASLCMDCRTRFFQQHTSRCTQCGNLLNSADDATATCGHCLKTPPAYDQTWIAADYVPPLDQLVLSLKFASQLALAPLFARLLHNAVQASGFVSGTRPDLIVPMPLCGTRLRERGFNQALEIARPLARLLDIPLATRLCRRDRDTHSQSLLPLKERAKNVRNAFTVAPASQNQINGRHIAIVDDVMTTGATLNELANTLKRAGASRVSNLVVARAL